MTVDRGCLFCGSGEEGREKQVMLGLRLQTLASIRVL